MFDPDPDLIDYHCHLDLYKDYEQQFEICERRRIATLAVTTTPRAWNRNRELASNSRFVRVGLGLHPQLIGQISEEITLFEKLISNSIFVGEVGLDASPAHYATFQKQKAVFTRILKACAEEGGKILSVHSVRAGKTILDMLEEHLPRNRGRVVLHWFSGSITEARRAIGLGCYFSVNNKMFKKTGRSSLVEVLPIDRILTETDGPFVVSNNSPVGPGDTQKAVSLISSAHGKTEHEVRGLLRENLARLESMR